jgi:Holliday junction resolvase RusA-like endonuclease
MFHKFIGPIQGYVQATIMIYLKPAESGDLPSDRGDLDNYIKSIVDGLQYGGIFAPRPGCKKGNDKMVIRYGFGTGIYSDEDERVELLLEQIKLN